MKKKITTASILGFVILLAISLIKTNIQDVFLGDYILSPMDNNKKSVEKYNTNFSNTNLTSEILLEYLDYNALDLKTNKKINDLIKKSKNIYLSIGLNDLLENVSLVEDKLIYSPTLINEKLALIEYNIHEIVSSILAIKDVNIYYFSWYYLNDEPFDFYIEDFNSEIKEVLEELNVNYIETNDLITINNYTFSNVEQKIIYDYIVKH